MWPKHAAARQLCFLLTEVGHWLISGSIKYTVYIYILKHENMMQENSLNNLLIYYITKDSSYLNKYLNVLFK